MWHKYLKYVLTDTAGDDEANVANPQLILTVFETHRFVTNGSALKFRIIKIGVWILNASMEKKV